MNKARFGNSINRRSTMVVQEIEINGNGLLQESYEEQNNFFTLTEKTII